MRISDFFPNNGGTANSLAITAGLALSQNDMVALAYDGYGYPVACTDYAAVANTGTFVSAAQGQIVAPTTIFAAAYQNLTMRRPKALKDASGNNIVFGNGAGSLAAPTDTKMYKYSPGGTLLKSLVMSTGLTGNMYGAYMFRLSNNNIAVVFGLYSAGIGNLYFAVCDDDLNIVVAATAIEATYGITSFGACSLSGGGFAVSYTLNATPTAQRLVIYSNAGAATYGPTTINTWAGTGGNTSTVMAELSSGNIAIACNSGSGTNPGLYHAIRNTAGAQVLTFTRLETPLINNGATAPEISSMTGFYSVAIGNGTNMKGYVFDNTGATQGAAFSSAGTIVAELNAKLFNDGTAFYLIWPDNSASSITKLTKLPTTGTGYVSYTITTAVAYTGTVGAVDAFVERGLIVAIRSSKDTTAPTVGVIGTDGLVKKTAASITASAPTNGALDASITPIGDFAFLACYDDEQIAEYFMQGKYANASVLGVCSTAATVGTLALVAQNIGAYATNRIIGTSPKTFDHTTGANIYGNKGALLNNGAVLKGL